MYSVCDIVILYGMLSKYPSRPSRQANAPKPTWLTDSKQPGASPRLPFSPFFFVFYFSITSGVVRGLCDQYLYWQPYLSVGLTASDGQTMRILSILHIRVLIRAATAPKAGSDTSRQRCISRLIQMRTDL